MPKKNHDPAATDDPYGSEEEAMMTVNESCVKIKGVLFKKYKVARTPRGTIITIHSFHN